MSENLTGKYLDGAGLSKVWEKVKSYSSSNYLPLTGGTLTGPLTLTSAITSNNQATTKKYVDDKVSTVTSSLGNYLPLTGGTLTGPLTLTGTDGNGTITSEGLIAKNGLFVGTDGGDNVWDAYVSMRYNAGYFVGQTAITSGLGDNEVNINIMPKAVGDNGKGRIDISGPQITFNDIEQTNKGITFTPTLATFNVPTSATSINLSSAITADAQATTKKYVDDKVNTSLGNYLPLTGGTLQGNLNMGYYKFTVGNVNSPVVEFVFDDIIFNTSISANSGINASRITLSNSITANNQATTKKYVDDKVSSSINTAISSLNEVLKFKGSINSTSALPTSAELGWVYLVSEEGTYAGEACEVGDMIICTTASTTAPTWTIIQRNIPGVMSNDEIDSICTY